MLRTAAILAVSAALFAACGPTTPDNKAPTVTVAPATQSVLLGNAATKIVATAQDSDGSISKVEFLDGSSVVETDSTAPYEFTPPVSALGEKTYTARATDNKGAMTTSSAGARVTVVTSAGVRAVHAVSDLSGVDLRVGGAVAGTNLTFPNVFPGAANQYARVPTTVLDVKVCATGSSTECPITLTPTLPANSRTTVIAVGTAATNDDTGADARPIEAVVLSDTGVVDPVQAKVRLVHAASLVAAKSVDVYITAPDGDLATATPNSSAFAYKAASEYITVAPGSYRVRITAAGTKTPVLIDTGSSGVPVAAGKLYTGVAVNPSGGNLASGVVLLQDN